MDLFELLVDVKLHKVIRSKKNLEDGKMSSMVCLAPFLVNVIRVTSKHGMIETYRGFRIVEKEGVQPLDTEVEIKIVNH